MDRDKLYERFREKAEAVSTRVARVAGPLEAAALIGQYLREIPAAPGTPGVVWADTPILKGVDVRQVVEGAGWHFLADIQAGAREALVGVAEAHQAIAETGTLVQDGTPLEVRLVTTLPTHNIILVPWTGLVETMYDALSCWGERLPANLSCITGPSRTSDIERVLTIGVHGPETLLVIVVDHKGGMV